MRLVCLLAGFAAFAQDRESIDKQLKSVEQQRDSIRKSMPVLQPLVPAFDCDPLPEDKAGPMIEKASKARGVPVKLLRAVIEQESGYRPCAVSAKGAQGLMQVMPETAEQFHAKDAFDPEENLAAGAAFLRQLLEKYKGDPALSLAAYNAGPDAVDKAGAIPDIPETRAYVAAIVDKVGSKPIELAPLPAPPVPEPKPPPLKPYAKPKP